MDPYEFACEATEPGRDVAEGEIGYRIEERGGAFQVVEYLVDDPANSEVLERTSTRERAEQIIREYIDARGSDEGAEP